MQLLITTLLVVSAFAAEKSDAKQNEQGDKKNVKRGVFGLGYGGYGGYGGLGGYGGGLSSYGGSYHGGSLGGYYGGGGYGGHSHGYSSVHVAPHTHSHSVETKLVPQPYPVVKHVPVVQVSKDWKIDLIN